MSRKAKFDHTGSSFDDFLEAEGIREEVEAAAIKAVIAADLQRAMMQQKITKTALARRARHQPRSRGPSARPALHTRVCGQSGGATEGGGLGGWSQTSLRCA